MNHNKDIDDGLEDYIGADEREKDEARYACPIHKHAFKLPEWQLKDDVIADNIYFEPAHISELRLFGPRIKPEDTPFAYESGLAVVRGTLHGQNTVMTLRWSDNGFAKHACFEDIA